MKVKWLGHACFLLTSDSGLRIITDPYTAGVFGLDHASPSEMADVVTVSHDHRDDNNVAAVKGDPQVVRGVGSQKAKGIHFHGVASAHDRSSGSERGANTIFCFALDGTNVCHLGDLGHDLSYQTVADMGERMR
jgi:L-ascorbate metabolism protein UlaG (beta-lactamase superfamily)